jgi:HSP20 family protein
MRNEMFVRRVRPQQPILEGSPSHSDPVRRELWRSFGDPVHDVLGAEVFPRMNITQDDENLYLHAELPGVDPDQLSVSALRNSVSLAGKRVLGGAQARTRDGLGREGSAFDGAFDCTFDCTVALPAEVDADRVDAGYCDGILALTLPKARRGVAPGPS